MPDDTSEKPEVQSVEPDTSSWEQAKRDLLSDLDDSEGGYHPEGIRRLGRMENGVRVITYTCDTPPQAVHCPASIPEGELFYPLTDREDRALVRRALDEIEKVANIRFREIPTEDIEQKGGGWEINYLKGKFKGDTAGLYAGGGSVLLSDNSDHMNLHNTLHETLHALGISHPGARGRGGKAGGDNPLYTGDTTVMSYNPGVLERGGLGAFDVAALQAVYGKPKPEPELSTVPVKDVLNARFLYTRQPLTLDISDLNSDYKLDVECDYGITGFKHSFPDSNFVTKMLEPLGYKPESTLTWIEARLTEGTRIQDVLTSPNTEASLAVTGNNLRNRLQGGRNWDTLVPRGGKDVLTGSGGNDSFILDGASGFNNIVTDLETVASYTPKDNVRLFLPITKAELYWHDRFLIDGAPCQGTELLARDKDDAPVASMFILNTSPEKVREAIKPSWDRADGDIHVAIVKDKTEESIAKNTGDGNKFSAHFTLHGESGFDNVIGNLDAFDTLVMKAPIAGVELEKRDGKNTLLTAKNAAGERVASAYILKASPEQVSEKLQQVAANTPGLKTAILAQTDLRPIDMPEGALLPPATPSSTKIKAPGAGK